MLAISSGAYTQRPQFPYFDADPVFIELSQGLFLDDPYHWT
ncbi:hypothetical protein C4K23_5380 [Pseudomonas chlororaphis]|nr:hypothetical protein C4K23_5380 [Pseudomonas chlororaphis]